MPVFTIVECEMCSNNFRFQPMQRPYERDIPPEWFTVIQGNPQGQEGWHFCSKDCLNAWIVAQSEMKP